MDFMEPFHQWPQSSVVASSFGWWSTEELNRLHSNFERTCKFQWSYCPSFHLQVAFHYWEQNADSWLIG